MSPCGARGAPRLLAVTAMMLVGACASYRSQPLADESGATAAADAATLAQVAATIRVPRLAPLPIPPHGPWNDLQLADIAVLANPDLQALRLQDKVAQAQVFAAGLLPDPQIGLGSDRPDGGGLVSAFGVNAGLDVAALLMRENRVQAARANAEQVHAAIAWQEWLVANQVRLLVRRCQYLRQQQALAAAAAESADTLVALTERAVAAHDARTDDLALRRAAALDAHSRVSALTRDLQAARMQLNQSVGVVPDVKLPLATLASLHDPSTLDVAELEGRALNRRWDLSALRAGYAAQETAVRGAILAQYPFPVLTVSRARDTTPVYTKGATLSVTLPLWNRNRGNIAIATATREQLHAEYSARVFDMRAAIAAQVAALQQLAVQRQTLDAEIEKLAVEIAPLERAASRGDVSVVTLESMRSTLVDKRIAASALAQAQSEGEVALSIETGGLAWH